MQNGGRSKVWTPNLKHSKFLSAAGAQKWNGLKMLNRLSKLSKKYARPNNAALEHNGNVRVVTDLEEYVQILDGQPPYQLVTPAMRNSKEDIETLFSEKLGTDPSLTPEQLTLIARDVLREK